jgi:diguanylate cyclase (GGDEF)-like protein
VTAAWKDRRVVFALAAALEAALFAACIVDAGPRIGFAHFFYVPICIAALASDALLGALAGLFAAALYALALATSSKMPPAEVYAAASSIRLLTFCGVGVIVGSFAKRNRTLVAQLRQRALEDPLTEVGNAQMFDEELARRGAAGLPFTLVLVDIDDFGHINETHGHDAGDKALRAVANAMRGIRGRTDVVARIGGDEFALITNRPADQTALVCRRISRAVGAEAIHLSFGTTACPDDGTTVVELFRKADDRLFAAKLVSRNRRTVVALNRP